MTSCLAKEVVWKILRSRREEGLGVEEVEILSRRKRMKDGINNILLRI